MTCADPMRIGVVGCGAVGARAARQLLASEHVESLVVFDHRASQAQFLAESLGARASVRRHRGFRDLDGVVLATAAGSQFAFAHEALAAGCFVVSTSDRLDEVRLLRSLDHEAIERNLTVVLGAGFAPGLTCVLARLGAQQFDAVDEIHVAKVGTGGPDCARQHHRAFRGLAVDWRDGAWVERRGGSGRELCWFPEPIGGRDCYRAALADPILMVEAFSGLRRATARVAASRRDRLTMQLPMMRPPHVDGGVGAVRVELRGRRGAATQTVILGAIGRPAVVSGAVAAQACLWVGLSKIDQRGAAGLAVLAEPKAFLRELADRGVTAALFDGTPRHRPLPVPTR